MTGYFSRRKKDGWAVMQVAPIRLDKKDFMAFWRYHLGRV